jgi:hypothetical protein
MRQFIAPLNATVHRVGLDVPITVLSDGGEDVDSACSLPAANEQILDWLHIGMRCEHPLGWQPSV